MAAMHHGSDTEMLGRVGHDRRALRHSASEIPTDFTSRSMTHASVVIGSLPIAATARDETNSAVRTPAFAHSHHQPRETISIACAANRSPDTAELEYPTLG